MFLIKKFTLSFYFLRYIKVARLYLKVMKRTQHTYILIIYGSKKFLLNHKTMFLIKKEKN